MAKKKKSATAKNKEFSRDPFSHLKGFAVSADKEQDTEKQADDLPSEQAEKITSFAEEMSLLGVEKLAGHAEEDEALQQTSDDFEALPEALEQAEDELFVQAMGELRVDFSDKWPAAELPRSASANRMKLLKKGKLAPQATLDLHGYRKADVAEKIQFFLQNAAHQGWKTVLVITGRGLHSADGEPVLRNEAERYLASDGRKWVVEWGRAPKQYGGDGALVLFVREK